jgi:hypothetical protein
MNKKTPAKHANRKSHNMMTTAQANLKHGAAKVESALKEGSSKVGSALKEGSATVESRLKKPGSPERVAVGVAAAAGGALVAAATLGVGPTALAGVAGYAAYRGMKKGEKKVPAATGHHKH